MRDSFGWMLAGVFFTTCVLNAFSARQKIKDAYQRGYNDGKAYPVSTQPAENLVPRDKESRIDLGEK